MVIRMQLKLANIMFYIVIYLLLYCVMYFVPVNIMNSSATYIVALNDALIRLSLKIYLTDELQSQPDWNPSPLVVMFGTGTLVTYGRSAATREWLRSKDIGRLSVADLWIVSYCYPV